MEPEPLPNPLALAKVLKENFGETITHTKPFRNGKGYLIFTRSLITKNQLTEKTLSTLLPGVKVKVKETKNKPKETRNITQ